MNLSIFIKFKGFKIGVLRPCSLQHSIRKVFEFPNDRAKVRTPVDERGKFSTLLHEDEKSYSPIVAANSAMEWLGGPLGPEGKQDIVVTLRCSPLVQGSCKVGGHPVQIKPNIVSPNKILLIWVA